MGLFDFIKKKQSTIDKIDNDIGGDFQEVEDEYQYQSIEDVESEDIVFNEENEQDYMSPIEQEISSEESFQFYDEILAPIERAKRKNKTMKRAKVAQIEQSMETMIELPMNMEDKEMQGSNVENLNSINNIKNDVITAVEDTSYRIQEGLDENKTVLERSINENAEKILEAIKNTTVSGVDDLDDMSRLQYFKNLKISLLSFVLAIFSGLMIITSLLSLIKLMSMDGNIELVLIDYIFVAVFAVASISLSLYQKKCFSRSRTFRDYLVSRSQVDSIARWALWIVIGVLIISFFVMISIVVGIIVRYY